MQESDVDHSVPGSGVWEKSDSSSRWIVVAEGSHKIPRSRLRASSEGSVDPGLSIQTFITSFEVELPQVGDNSSLVSDGSSLVRFDNPVVSTTSVEAVEGEAGPSGEAGGGSRQQPPDRTTRRHRRQKRKRSKYPKPGGLSHSVESSPGRECPSPDSLMRIIHKNRHRPEFL